MTPNLPGFEMQQQLVAALQAALLTVQGVTNVQPIPAPAAAQTPALSEALLVTTVHAGQFVCHVQPQLTPTPGVALRALNPVTFRPQNGPLVLTIGRLHIGTSLTDMVKYIPVAVWNESQQTVLAHLQLDEATFMSGLSCLFPNGELAFGR